MKVGNWSFNEEYFTEEQLAEIRKKFDPDAPLRCPECGEEVELAFVDEGEVMIDVKPVLSYELVDPYHCIWDTQPVRIAHRCKDEAKDKP